MTIYFITYYQPGNAGALGQHGRYFIPFVPLLFIAAAGLFEIPDKWKPFTRSAAIVSFLIVTAAYSFGIYTTYYTYCGYGGYTGGQCIVPIYKNIEKESVPEINLNAGEAVSQTFTLECNGLESVGVFIKTIPANAGGSLKFSALDENGHVLAEKNFPVSEITAFDYLTLPVNPAAGTPGSNFKLTLEASDPGVGIGYIQGGFHSGELTIAGTATKHDLIYHYACAHP
jgi:hypothetical protein